MAGNKMRFSYKSMFAVLVLFTVLLGCRSSQVAESSSIFCDKLARASVEVLADGRMAGSGAFVSPDGYVLTAAHYITSPEIKLEALSASVGRFTAKLVAIDKGHDIALLKINTANKLPCLSLSKQDLQAGQAVFIVGSPLNRHGLLLQAAVASRQADYEYLTDQGTYLRIWYINTMAPRGLSGGNWVNADGQVVGVQSGWINEQIAGTNGHVNSGIAFIAGREAICRLIDTKENADTPSIGGIVEELWTQAPGFQARFKEGTEGIVIHHVRPGGPLDNAGLAHEDVIVEAEGKKVRYRRQLLDTIRAKKPGETLRIRYVSPDDKDGGEKEVVLDSLERNWLKQNSLEK